MAGLTPIESRRRNLRIVLMVIIMGTIPLYVIGLMLWGTAPAQNAPVFTQAPGLTLTTSQALVTNTPAPATSPTVPPATVPIFGPTSAIIDPQQPTRSLSPTPFIPTATFAPTLTPYPTQTLPPSASPTTLFFPTDTVVPFEGG